MKTQTLFKLLATLTTGLLAYFVLDSKEKKDKIKELEISVEEREEKLANQQKSIDLISERINQIQKPSFKPSDLSCMGQADVLTEAGHAYGLGLFRSSAIMSGAVIESILQEQYKQQLSFYHLIERAKEDKLINEKETHALNLVRKERNNVHDLKNEISQQDALISLNITIAISEKFIQYNKQKVLV